MKSIDEIHIENVKGISKRTFTLTLIPFMPTFLVAPNGFGKSSLAVAFNSLNRSRLKIDEKNSHNGDVSNIPQLKLTFTKDDKSKSVLVANDKKNEISKVFDIEVIRSLLKPEANYKNIQGKPVTSPTIEIESIHIIENIPDKFILPYKVTEFKKLISDNRHVWIDISDVLQNSEFIARLAELEVLQKFELQKQSEIIQAYIQVVKSIKENKEHLLNKLKDNHLEILRNQYFLSIFNLLNQYNGGTEPENILITIQIIELYKNNKEGFKKLFEYSIYTVKRDDILKLFNSFQSTWKSIIPQEINITRKVNKKTVTIQKNFSIVFPKATDISNGERDVILFIGCLLKAQINFKGKPTILIIDEVFDYLDDANLLAVQYYITKFIEFFKSKTSSEFFPIILTHLNPYYFKNYFFSKQKVHYLLPWKGTVDRAIESLVISRNNTKDKTYEDNISSYFLHYNPQEFDVENTARFEFSAQKLNNFNSSLCKSEEFKKIIFNHFDNYLSGKKSYDPISICVAARILVEKHIYSQLPNELQNDFLETHTTVAKLNFAKENTTIIIPEIYYFLGTLYNELLHIRKNNDNSSPIYLKLNNITIREMIKQIKR